MTPLHLGALHPVETVLTLILAFGPFIALGVVIVVRRRQDRAEPDSQPEGQLDGQLGEQGDAQRDR